LFYDRGDVVVLEEADGSDAGGSGGEAGLSILQSDSAQGEDWDVRIARLLECEEARGACVFLFENRGEYCKRRAGVGGLGYFSWGVTGNSDQRISW
jgi:hypothetical protein